MINQESRDIISPRPNGGGDIKTKSRITNQIRSNKKNKRGITKQIFCYECYAPKMQSIRQASSSEIPNRTA